MLVGYEVRACDEFMIIVARNSNGILMDSTIIQLIIYNEFKHNQSYDFKKNVYEL